VGCWPTFLKRPDKVFQHFQFKNNYNFYGVTSGWSVSGYISFNDAVFVTRIDMRSKKILLGLIVAPLATSVIISALAILLAIMAADVSSRDATDGINRLLLFNTILSYIVAVVVGIPLCILSIKRQWHKLWQNSVVGFTFGIGLGVVVAVILSLYPSFKWIDSYSPVIEVIFMGAVGSVTMTTLWPFIEHGQSSESE
jgi:hypothetical protein